MVRCSLSKPDRGHSTSTDYPHSGRPELGTCTVQSRHSLLLIAQLFLVIDVLIDQLVNHVLPLGNSVPWHVLDVQLGRPDHLTVGRVSVELDVPYHPHNFPPIDVAEDPSLHEDMRTGHRPRHLHAPAESLVRPEEQYDAQINEYNQKIVLCAP